LGFNNFDYWYCRYGAYCLTCGKLEKAGMDSLKETHIDKYDVIEVPLFFQNNRLNLRLAFNSDGKIDGLFFLPVNQ